MSDLSMLMDMGFDKSQAERALQVTGNKGVEPAMEWLLAHSDVNEPVPQDTFTDGEKSEGLQTQMEVTESANDDHSEAAKALDAELAAQAKSLKCDECNKKFRTDSEVEFHAVKTGHQSFSESSEEFKPLSEEEKKEQIKKLETIIKQRRAEREEQEKKEALEKEISRRKTGQEITQVRQKMQEQEMKQLAEAKRREKLEAKEARQRVLEQIERDKQARREKFNMPNPNPPATSPIEPPKAIVTPVTPPTENYDQTRIQVRMMNGECLTHTFSPNEELAAVRLFVQMNHSDGSIPFSLMTNFPKKVFTEEDMNTPLSKLGLVPSAVIIVCKPQ
ncbi:UBX domain-containing protein 1-B [Araneus ventricosus]|uniref:UBX domain-containing protein 1-B n=1 Tax=Araneus ventricosus TaxID=182803 RepID=A0A4Y2C4H1_ARAVE|nr:UBX domain-containing protein 1-B [Araneus ventricosus]